MQLLIFLPLALIRNLAKLSTTALIADVFILAGLIYIFGSEMATIAKDGVADVKMFNSKDFPLLIGSVGFDLVVSQVQRLTVLQTLLGLQYSRLKELVWWQVFSYLEFVVLMNKSKLNKGIPSPDCAISDHMTELTELRNKEVHIHLST